MIPHDVFNARIAVCRGCVPWFEGVCTKGHVATSPMGCPIGKFAPYNGAAVSPDKRPTLPTTSQKSRAPCVGCGTKVDVKPMTWPQVLQHFAESMREWLAAGVPLAGHAEHSRRYTLCEACAQFKYYQCRICRCICWIKTALATEQCSAEPPKWTRISK